MTITLYSLLTTFLWTSILFLLLFFCRRSILVIRWFGIQFLLLLFACSLFRLCVAIELPFTKVIRLPQVLNPIVDFCNFEIMGYSVLRIIIIIWLMVAILRLLRLTRIYHQYIKQIKQLPTITTKQIDQISSVVVNDRNVKITLDNGTHSPLVCGFWHSLILLPNVVYTDQELQVILQHEYAHIQNHDAYIRLMAEIFCAINPLLFLMRRELDNILELKCDRRVIQGKTKDEIAFYGETLLKFSQKNIGNPIPFTTSEFSEFATIKQRLKLLFPVPLNQKVQKLLSVVIGLTLVGTLTFSYLFIFQSFFLPQQGEIWGIAHEPQIVKNADGTYSVTVIVDGMEFSYLITADDKTVMEAEYVLP